VLFFSDGDIFTADFAHLIAPVVATASVTLGCNKIQNGDILVPANPGPCGIWLIRNGKTDVSERNERNESM